jgi:uncharacterized small protein (DUF1192 family)
MHPDEDSPAGFFSARCEKPNDNYLDCKARHYSGGSMTAEEHVRTMVGDLMMQIAMLRAKIDELEESDVKKSNGKDPDAAADYRPQSN